MTASVWKEPLPGDIQETIRHLLLQGEKYRPIQVFFRADDIGPVDAGLRRLMNLFATHRTPLCLALVPAWLNRGTWEEMEEFTPADPLWCWHQHGWSHRNHEMRGKKCEFGPSRERDSVRADLLRGRDLLADLQEELFVPVFTPPWNRCSSETMELLVELGFSAVSRSEGAVPPTPAGLADLAINVDLHTRKEQGFREGWTNLLGEITKAARSGRIGFMIHHELMNATAYEFLEVLLEELSGHSQVTCCTFRELLPMSRK